MFFLPPPPRLAFFFFCYTLIRKGKSSRNVDVTWRKPYIDVVTTYLRPHSKVPGGGWSERGSVYQWDRTQASCLHTCFVPDGTPSVWTHLVLKILSGHTTKVCLGSEYVTICILHIGKLRLLTGISPVLWTARPTPTASDIHDLAADTGGFPQSKETRPQSLPTTSCSHSHMEALYVVIVFSSFKAQVMCPSSLESSRNHVCLLPQQAWLLPCQLMCRGVLGLWP